MMTSRQLNDVDLSNLAESAALVNTAMGILIALHGYDGDAALAELTRVAHAHTLTPATLAEALLNVASTRGRHLPTVTAQDVVDAEWGEDLSFARSPLLSPATPIIQHDQPGSLARQPRSAGAVA
jgi:hypothetical protein